MKACVYDRYGSPDVLELKEVGVPVPGDDEVLVQVGAASIQPYDWHFMRGLPLFVRLINGLRRPKKATIVGSDVAGTVASVGRNVARFRPGDEVFGEVNTGGCAEYISVHEDKLASKPVNLTFGQAAAVPLAAMTALQALRDSGEVGPGRRVLINGASGGVGTFAVQIAKSLGAEVTGVCSARNVDMVRSLGADHVVDYGERDFARGADRYDVIVDNMDRSLSDLRRALTPRGTVVLVGGSNGRWINGLGRVLKARLLAPLVRQNLRPCQEKATKEDLAVLKELIEAGKVKPVIDRTFTLSETPEAMRYLETGRARGKVVVTV